MGRTAAHKVTDEIIRNMDKPRYELSTGQVAALVVICFIAAAMIGSAVAWVVWPLVEWIAK